MLDSPIRYLKGVGPKKEILLRNLGINTTGDLLYYFPFRYEDRRNFKKIKELSAEGESLLGPASPDRLSAKPRAGGWQAGASGGKESEACLIKAKVLVKKLRKIPYYVRTTRIRSIFEVVIEDNSGRASCVWFNQGYLSDLINVGDEIIIYGKPSLVKKEQSGGRRNFGQGTFKFNSPEYELVTAPTRGEVKRNDSLNLGRIVGFYRLTANLNQNFMRKIIHLALKNSKAALFDPLPFDIRKEKNLPNIVKGLEEMHFPSAWQEAEAARERFIFEELFHSQILVYLRKAQHRLQKGVAFKVRESLIKRIKENISFSLTASQEEALSKIISDLVKPYPMHRLLQGDVGSGKTVVSAFAIATCIDNGYQSALMVPTEVLTFQHKETLEEIFKGLGFKIKVLVSSLMKKEQERVHQELKEGAIDLIVGTHSLIQEEVGFKKLGLVVIDEQHKFGVAQRALLPKKGKLPLHCLVMSATPIPRSLALTLYGDLDLSLIKEMPKGRIAPKTLWVKEEKRSWVYDFIRQRLKEGRQVYIIYPVIEESEIEDLKSLNQMYERILKEFRWHRVGMFHGKLAAKDKLEVIKKFRAKKIDILVSTTVVEVGLNIENATTMIVESPQRFGLAQLHQLRGRIQRSLYQPYFILISKNNLSPNALVRLKTIVAESCGFKIAEEDLKLRGPGDFFGFTQHGFPQLKIANPLKDLELLKQARLFAYRVIKRDPYLEEPAHRCIRDHLPFGLIASSTFEVEPAGKG